MTLAVAMPTAAELISRATEKYNPLQSRDREGQWTDGLPDDLVSTAVKVMGGSVTASSKRGGGGKATLSANGRSVDLDDRDIEGLRKMVVDAQYGDDSRSGSDGVFRVSRHHLGDDGKVKSEILVSLRPVEGKFISETGKKFSNLDDGPDGEESYTAEFDMVVGEGSDGEFADYPSTRVSIKDLETDTSIKSFYAALQRATVAQRIDTGNGPTDVFSPRAGVVGFRMKDDNGDPTEVMFNAGEARRLKMAIEDVLYGEGEGVFDLSIPRDEQMAFETSGGFVEARFKGHKTDHQWVGTLTLLPDKAPWSVAVDGPAIDDFMGALTRNGSMAGIRAFESVRHESDLGVRSMPAIRALEALSSPAVQLMMLARTIEARDIISRRGRQVVVERGRGGKFAKMGSIGDVVDAVQKAAGASHSDEHGYRAGMLSRPRAERRGWLASQMQQYGGADDTSDRVEQVATGMGIDTSGVSRYQASGKKNISEMLDLMVGSANAEDDAASVLAPSVPKPRRSAVAKAMASGDTNALDGFGREALRREAKSRGIDLPRGVHEDVIRDMLWDHDHNEYAETFKAPEPDRPKPGGSASGLGRDSGEEEIFAAFNRMGSEQEIKDALAGKDADTLRFLGEEIGVRTHRNDTDPEKIKAHIARSVAAGLSNVRFRTGARGNDRDVADAAPASSAKPARTSRAKADTPDGSYFSTFAVGFKASQQADREKALAKKAAAEPDVPQAKPSAARKPKATKPDRAEQMAAISGRADVWGDLRKAHEEEGHAAPLESSRPAKAFKPARRPKPLTAEERRANADAISGGQDIWGKLRQAHEEDRAKAAPKAKADVPSAVDALKPMVDNAKPGDREKTADILSKLTGKQLEEVAQSFGSTVSHHRTVGQKRTQLTERLVGHQLNSNTIRNGVWEDSDAQTAKFEQQQSIARQIKADSAPSAARKVMGTQMSLPMQQALVKVEDSGGLEMRRAEFQNDYKLNDREFDQLLDNGFIEVDEKAGMGFIGITPRGLKALDALKGDR